MEVAIILSSIAGAATAATMNRFPKKGKAPLLGANSQIKSQIETLKIEKDILTKTISRLYADDSDLTKIQRDKLLSRYQNQLGIILAKIEKLQEASKYPDLGPLGDGLLSLMDKKLATLDNRLAEISSKLSAPQIVEKPAVKKEELPKEKPEIPKKPTPEKQLSSESIEDMIKSFAKVGKRLELTTLTEIPTTPSNQYDVTIIREPLVQTPNTIHSEAEIISQHITRLKPHQESEKLRQYIDHPIDVEKQIRSEPPKLEFKNEPKQEPKKKLQVPEPEPVEVDDEDDLDSIKREIMKTLSKLEQAEVE